MTWLTSLPAVVLVAGGLVLALLATLGGRLAVRALVPATEREAAYTIAAPLMPALGALFALFMGLTLASEASFLASAQGIVSNEAADASRLTGVALIVNASALTLRSGRRSALLTGSLASVIGLSLALLFALGTPWRGAITVSGQPIDAVTQGLNTGYFTP
jgi:hypothetical protein